MTDTLRPIDGENLFSYWTPPQPRELPALREAIASHLLTGPSVVKMTAMIETGILNPDLESPHLSAIVMLGEEKRRLKDARLYYVDQDMTATACRAGDCLTEFRLQPEDLPSKTGFIVFADTLGRYVSKFENDPSAAHIVAASWGPTSLVPADTGCMWVTFWSATNYQRMKRLLAGRMKRSTTLDTQIRALEAELTWDNETLVFFGAKEIPVEEMVTGSTGDHPGIVQGSEGSMGPWVQRLRATWLLMTQPNYAAVSMRSRRGRPVAARNAASTGRTRFRWCACVPARSAQPIRIRVRVPPGRCGPS